MNIYDIAKSANTSTATVSRALNGKMGVSDKTRKRIQKIVNESGYVLNSFAQGLNHGSIKTVGVLCYDINDLYCAKCVSILERLLRENGYNMILCSTGLDDTSKKKHFDILLSKRVDAIFLVSSKYTIDIENEYIAKAAAKTPVALLNGYIDIDNIYCIVCDDRLAMEEAVSFLVARGHSRIAYLHGELIFSGKRQLEGYMDGIARNGLKLDRKLIVSNTFNCASLVADGELMTKHLLDSGLDFTAILVSDDPYAVGAMKALYAAGKKVPGDVEVIGYDNSSVCEYTTPELTSIDSRVDIISDLAVRYFLQKLKGEIVPKTTTLAANIVNRGSTTSIGGLS